MAKFGERFQADLCRKSDSIHIASCTDTDSILITSGERIIKLYNVADNKVVKDWTLRNHQLSSPAVAYGEPVQLCAVLNQTTVRTWMKDDLLVEKGRKTMARQAVYRLWAPACRPYPYIIHTDLSCVSLENTTDELVCKCLPDGADLMWSNQIADVFVVCFSEKRNADDVHIIVYQWSSESDSVTCTKHQVPLHCSRAKVQCFSGCTINSNIFLFILLSDGSVVRSCISATGGAITTEHFDAIPHTTISACCCLDNNQLAVVGAKDHGNYELSIWDLKFGLQHSFQTCERNKSNSYIHKIGSRLYIPCEDGIHTYPVTLERATLASALGRLTKLQDNMVTVSNIQESCKEHIQQARKVLQDLADTNKTPNKKLFKKAFGQFSKWSKSAEKEELLLIGEDISMLVQRIAMEQGFWPDTHIMHSVIECVTSQGSLLSVLMPALIKHQEMDIIHHALCTVTDVPETAVIQALAFYLRTLSRKKDDDNPPESFQQKKSSERKTSPTKAITEKIKPKLSCSYTAEEKKYINTALDIAHNDVFRVEGLREMEFSEILSLLRYLHHLMLNTTDNRESDTREGSTFVEQIIHWISQVLDAHLAQLLLSPDAKVIILDLHELIQSKMYFYKELVSLEGILWELKNSDSTAGQKVSNKALISAYCIHTLHIA